MIKNLIIRSTAGPAIMVNGYSGVQITNVVIHHNGGAGIAVAFAPSTTISNADIIFDGAPARGANPSTEDNNIDCLISPKLHVVNVRLTRGSSGIYLDRCPGSRLETIEGHDQRGPSPRGQLVQWNNSDEGILNNFSDENSLVASWTEDNVNVFQTSHVWIGNGLLDTNNSPSGCGVIVDNRGGNVTVENVDAVHQGDACFAVYGGGGHDVTFRQTRCAKNYCNLPRGRPLSNSVAWAIDPTSISGNLNIEQSEYMNLCNPNNVVWDAAKLSVLQVRKTEFTVRAPLRVKLCRYGY